MNKNKLIQFLLELDRNSKFNVVSDALLGSKLSIENYVDKIMAKANIIADLQSDELRGFLAFYDNDKDSRAGFLSFLAVSKSFEGLGIASHLINNAITILQEKNFLEFKLEVSKKNTKAIKFYTKFGFEVTEDKLNRFSMSKALGNQDNG